jgi:5,5'-dehydrodivanillate O-demethylase
LSVIAKDPPAPTPAQEIDFVHTAPGTLAGRYLRRSWQPVYCSRDLAVGQALPIRIMGEEYTLYRGESGKAFVVSSRCPHRRTLLSTGWVEGDAIRCLYHGWRFDDRGQCDEQPAEPAPFCQKVKIASYPVQEHVGLVFVYFGEGSPPPMPLWPQGDAFIKEHPGQASVALLPFNFFQSMENIVDYAHTYFVHQVGTEAALPRRTRAIPPLEIEETSFGFTEHMHHPDRPEGHPYKVSQIHFLMPNHCHIYEFETDATLLFWYVPIDDSSHLHFIVHFNRRMGPPERGWIGDLSADIQEVLSGRKRLHEMKGRYAYMVRLQDAVAIAGQGSIAERTGERLGQEDLGVIFLRQLWKRELGALAKGSELKSFEHPAELHGFMTGSPRRDVGDV